MNHVSKHTSSKVLLLAFVVALALFAAFAAPASAFPGYAEFCSDCHNLAAAAPTVQVTSGPGVDPVTYSVHQSSTGWAAYDLTAGSTRITGGTTSDATFTAPLGHYVRVCSSDGDATGTFTQAYLLTPAASSHGTTSPNTVQFVAPGGSQAFTFTADSGYHLTDVKVNGESNAAAVTAGSYTFTNVQADGAIAATFGTPVTTYTITATAGAGGTISPAGAQTVASGASKTFAITPAAGYRVNTLTVDGAAVAAAMSYTFTNVTANHTIAATFVAGVQKCTATITLTGLKSGVLKRGKVVTIKGLVKPAHAGSAKLTIQRKVGAKWVAAKTLARPINATSGAYSYGYKATKAGSYRVKTSVAKTALFTAATTAYKTFKVK